MPVSGAEIRVRFFSNDEYGVIASGYYTFSDSPVKVSFTFSDAIVHITDNSMNDTGIFSC
jgi:hypothetical protein